MPEGNSNLEIMQESDEKVSVYIVVLNWNGCQDVINCVQSLQKSKNNSYKIVIVDNNSTDDSVAQFRRQLPNINMIQNETNLGFSGGCNVGIRYALERGADYIWLLNPDTLVYEDTLDELLKCARGSVRAGIVGAAIYNMRDHDELQTWGGGLVNINTGKAGLVEKHGWIDYISGACMLIPSRVFMDVGMLDDGYFMYWEDADFSMRVKRAGYALLVAANARILHKESSTYRNLTRKAEYMAASSVRFFKLYAKYPVLTVLVSTGRRVGHELAMGRFGVALAALRAACKAMLKSA